MAKIELIRAGANYAFDSIDENGVITRMDTKPEMGGEGYGARPMQLLLNALAGCASIDILSILKKRKQEITDYKVTVDGQREVGKEPSLWTEIFLTFSIDGDVDRLSAKKAIDLSLDKYCSVAATLRAAGATIKYELILNGQ
ncbi:putative redox protein [Arachidicoccus rhizosphaerae]|jgi:putative redox protein|uniref:Putative redox protein n=1 Tax=Arachidicoccus rhizosphaerae TaxID=551991 RepID=A0A1H4BXM2_9BACT|nr:OsmC family protein [Arachidicoccus rhizosphaerae]SEA52833.1 putative redox protein [Arachidicoccus rhizosphaerae]